jgi:hypothetical protein
MENTSEQESQKDTGADSAGNDSTQNADGASTAGATQNGGDTGDAAILTKLDEVSQTLQAESDARQKAEKSQQKAEKRIVKLKRKLKDAGVDVEDDEDDEESGASKVNIEEVVARTVDERLAAAQRTEETALAKANRTIAELTTAIKSRAGAGNTGSGTNQDRYESEDDPTKNLTSGDRALLERRAKAEGISLKEYLKKHPVS